MSLTVITLLLPFFFPLILFLCVGGTCDGFPPPKGLANALKEIDVNGTMAALVPTGKAYSFEELQNMWVQISPAKRLPYDASMEDSVSLIIQQFLTLPA